MKSIPVNWTQAPGMPAIAGEAIKQGRAALNASADRTGEMCACPLRAFST
jgi:hypothetical protein